MSRASVLRPVSAFSSEDLPTFDRPAKAISVPRQRRQLVQLLRAEEEPALRREQQAPGLQRRRLDFRPALRSVLSIRFVPATGFASRVRRWISHCCATDSVLFQLQ